MIQVNDMKNMTRNTRKRAILEAAKHQIAPDNLGKLEQPFKLARILDNFISDYIEVTITQNNKLGQNSILDNENLRLALREKLDFYLSQALDKVVSDPRSVADMMKNPLNAYELAGAKELAFANKITRNLSTTMGSLWEKLADISPHAANPELEFGLKIKGIDIICKNIETGLIEFIQLKTTKNTLTGSQSGRTNSELRLYKNPVFAAAFDVSRGWTFQNDPNIPRIAGQEFWSRIGMDYQIVYEEVVRAIKQLEAKFVAAVSL